MKSLVCFVIMAMVHQALSAGWSYSGEVAGEYGPADWGQIDANCGGMRQSPIDIVTGDVVDADLGLFTLDDYTAQNSYMDFDNNGHGVTVRLAEDEEELYALSGGGLPGTYVATQFHLHWGSVNTRGSEHTVDGSAYPAELHMVHYRPQYDNLVAALTSGEWDACAVLGTLIEVGAEDNPAFDQFLNYISNISTYTSPIPALGKGNLPSFPLRSVLPFDLSEFYRYNGSLTIPNCYETVIWTVFKNTVSISQRQLDLLRAVESDETDPATNNTLPLVDNYRPTLGIYNRTVYLSAPEVNNIQSTPEVNNVQSTMEPTDAAAALSPISALLLSILCALLVLL